MKAYLVATAATFGLLVLAHAWRLAEEGLSVLRDPWFTGATLVAAALGCWALVLLRGIETK